MTFKLKIVDDESLPTVVEVGTPDGTEQLIGIDHWLTDSEGRLHVFDSAGARASYNAGYWSDVRRVTDVHLLALALGAAKAEPDDEDAADEYTVA